MADEIGNEVIADVVEIIPEEEVRICLFSMGEEHYAIPVEMLTEIIIPQKIFPVPTTPPHVIGIINLRGTIVPIVDIRPVLALPQRSSPGQIAIIKHEAMLLGILVDNVSEVISVPESGFLPLPAEPSGTQAVMARNRFIKSIIQRENVMAALLDIERVLEEIKLT